jgi:cytochrome o ubiquinol oxidase subunit 2
MAHHFLYSKKNCDLLCASFLLLAGMKSSGVSKPPYITELMKPMKKFVLSALSFTGAATLLSGCSQLLLLNPKGPVGDTERFVIIAALALMLIVVIPVIAMVLWFPRKYRASNPKATYMPDWSRSTRIELVVWLVPAAIITVLGILVWHTTYRLDPYKPIDTEVKPITIEAVSLDWKWLFIYPDQKIATVNQLVFPVNVPLSFRVTSGTVMTSFFIPQLGSQIYAMAGMQTRLHLMAHEAGTFAGQNQQFSGRGYSDMTFKAIATSREEFDDWVRKVSRSTEKLDTARFEKIAAPSVAAAVTHFTLAQADLFDRILNQFKTPAGDKSAAIGRGAASEPMQTGALEKP